MLAFYEALYGRFHELHQEIIRVLDTIPSDELDWKPGAEMNSLTVLIVHLTGAERFLVGDVIMGDPSNRNRNAEFTAEGLDKDELLFRLNEVEAYIKNALEQLKLEDLETMRIHPRHGNQVSVGWALLHALEHAANHLGHIQMTAQLWGLPEEG